jgi:hypothetical protein
MVNTLALQAAFDQCKGEIIIESEETEGATLIIGQATLAMRDAPELTSLDVDLQVLPPPVVKLMKARMAETFTPVTPRSVFGWELRVVNHVASYGSANGPQAMYETSPVDIMDYELRIPHETCLRLSKIVSNCTDLSSNARLMIVHHDDVKHYIPLSSDSPSFSLKDVKGFLKQDAVLCEGSVDIKDKMLQLMAFADKDSKIAFTIKDGKMTASVSSKIGKNSIYIAPFDKAETFNFLITLQQIMPITKYSADNVRIGVLLKDDKPFCLYVALHVVGGKKAKNKEDDAVTYSHHYIAATSGR